MAHVISDECISCGLCADECPSVSISEGEDKYFVDPDKCTVCGSCTAICPTEGMLEAEGFIA